MIKTLLILLFTSSLYLAQVDSLVLGKNDNLKVDSIKIIGNNITKDYIILRELTFKVGDIVNGQTLNFNSERIFSLGIFNKVKLYFKQTEAPVSNILIINVDESWYIYPIPFVRLRDKNINQASYGLYIQYKNFRGRNEEIKTKIELGYDPSYYIEYYNPLIIEKLNLSLLTNISVQKMLNKSTIAEKLFGGEFSYNFKKIDFTIGKRLDNFNFAYLGLGFSYADIKDVGTNYILNSNSNINRTFKLGLGYSYDTRDLAQYPLSGIYAYTMFTKLGFGLWDVNYNVATFDYRQYQKLINNVYIKWRFNLRHTFGNKIPFYDLSYLGTDNYIRGYKNVVKEGNNYLLGSFELVHPIIKNWDFSVDVPLLPKKLTSARIELYFYIFGDTGTVFNNRDKVPINNFSSGYGLGFTLLVLPFNSLRLEYAFNEYKRSELIIATGFSF